MQERKEARVFRPCAWMLSHVKKSGARGGATFLFLLNAFESQRNLHGPEVAEDTGAGPSSCL